MYLEKNPTPPTVGNIPIIYCLRAYSRSFNGVLPSSGKLGFPTSTPRPQPGSCHKGVSEKEGAGLLD